MAENRLASVQEMSTESSIPAAQKQETGPALSAAAREAGPGPRRTFSFWKGRVALYAILKALDVRPGDRVILPAYTCFAVPSAVVFAGAQPVYADIDPETFHPSAASMLAACRDGERPRAILVQHTFGIPANTAPIVAWAREQGIAVIEDCAHVLGSRYRDSVGAWQEVGTLGDAAFYSSQWNKPVSTGIGGWASTCNSELAAALERFHAANCAPPSFKETYLLAAQVAVRGLVSSPWIYWSALTMYRWLYMRGVLVGSSSGEELQGVMPGDYAKRMSGFQKFLLKRRMRDRSHVAHRRHLKAIYDDCLKSAGMAALKLPEYADAVPLRYPVRVSNKTRVLSEARSRRIELGDWYPHPIDLPNGVSGAAFGYQEGMCPEGERAAREVINLPMHGRIREREARRVVDFLKKVA